MNKEEIYDKQIAPLMTRIIDVCKANKIAMLASFHIPTDEHDDLECTTALLGKEFDPPENLLAALNEIQPPSSKPMMITTRDASGNVVRMDVII